MNRKVKYFIFLILWIIVVISLIQVFKMVDYNRIKAEKSPFFSIQKGVALDGGSVEWKGLGYKIYAIDKVCGYKSVEVGGFTSSMSDFHEKEKEYTENPEYLKVTLISCKKESKYDEGSILGYESELTGEIMKMLEKADFKQGIFDYEEYDETYTFVEDLEKYGYNTDDYIVIAIENKENSAGYYLIDKDGDTYLINYKREEYRLDDKEAKSLKERITSEIESNTKKVKAYGNSYNLRNKVILSAIIIAMIIVTFIIIDNLIKQDESAK